MKWAYRRKDYFFPRSMKEAYVYDETYEPEIRCCSELFYEKPKSAPQGFMQRIKNHVMMRCNIF
jgi:hypothetical protein